jgi:hypothetical protein
LCFGLAPSLVGGGIHAALGSFKGAVITKLLIGGIPGAITGSMLALRVPSAKLRYALSTVMVAPGAQIWTRFAVEQLQRFGRPISFTFMALGRRKRRSWVRFVILGTGRREEKAVHHLAA